MKTVDVEELRDDLAALLESMDGFGLLVTRDGKPIARVVPPDANSQVLLYGRLAGKLKITGDIMSTGEWVEGA